MGFGAQPHGGSPFGTTAVVSGVVVKQLEGSISIGTALAVDSVLRSRGVDGVIGINSALGPAAMIRVRFVNGSIDTVTALSVDSVLRTRQFGGSIDIVTTLSVPGFLADLEGVITITSSLAGELTKIVAARPDIEAMILQIDDDILTIYFDRDNSWPSN